jgi:hypothetical protein
MVEMPRRGPWCAVNLDLFGEDSWSREAEEGGGWETERCGERCGERAGDGRGVHVHVVSYRGAKLYEVHVICANILARILTCS